MCWEELGIRNRAFSKSGRRGNCMMPGLSNFEKTMAFGKFLLDISGFMPYDGGVKMPVSSRWK